MARETTTTGEKTPREKMSREISAGGVVLKKRNERWWIAAIELPQQPRLDGDSVAGGDRAKAPARGAKPTLCLPKGLIDPGEKPLTAALREVREETGISAEVVTKLGDSKYVYVRSWGDRQKVFKIVSFYLLRYKSGRIDDVTASMRVEVARALWIPLEEAPKLLAYKGEKEMARRSLEYVTANPDPIGLPLHPSLSRESENAVDAHRKPPRR